MSAAGNKLPLPSARGGFVVNLAASTTPVTLVQPTHAALKGYTFFVSRRREDGRERFRLHMGYFESQQDAEMMLDVVREIFPAAWPALRRVASWRRKPPVSKRSAPRCSRYRRCMFPRVLRPRRRWRWPRRLRLRLRSRPPRAAPRSNPPLPAMRIRRPVIH